MQILVARPHHRLGRDKPFRYGDNQGLQRDVARDDDYRDTALGDDDADRAGQDLRRLVKLLPASAAALKVRSLSQSIPLEGDNTATNIMVGFALSPLAAYIAHCSIGFPAEHAQSPGGREQRYLQA